MTVWKTTTLAAALVAAGGIGAAFSPVARGQSQRGEARVAPAPATRSVQMFSGDRSEIGVRIRDLGSEDVRSAKPATPAGALIASVTEDGPADKAGMKAGDIVTEFDGERIRGARQFSRVVEETPAGRSVQAVVVRDGQRSTLTVQPRQARGGFRLLTDFDGFDNLDRFVYRDIPTPPAPTPPAAPTPPRVPRPVIPDFGDLFGGGASRLGITVDELTPQLADYFGTKDGVLVRSVTENSNAAKAGMKAGDVVTSFNGETVNSASDLRRRIARLDEGAEFTIGIVRDKKAMTLKGKLEGQQERRRTYWS
jgi:serine protease Do